MPNCIFFIAHAQNGHISTSRQKSDVTIVFSDPDYLYDAVILAIREHLRQILRFSYLHGFSGQRNATVRVTTHGQTHAHTDNYLTTIRLDVVSLLCHSAY